MDAGYSDEAVKEIAYVAASTVMSNRLTTVKAYGGAAVRRLRAAR